MACVMWGLMSPIGKDAMQHGMDNINLVFMRAAGGALLFWLTSLLCKHEHMPWRDVLAMSGAGLLGLVGNQCCFTIGLSITTPSNASIVTTSLPIFAMILSALILKEPITGKKALGVGIGCSGALILIMSSAAAHDSRIGDIRGDLLCISAQLSFALYLALYAHHREQMDVHLGSSIARPVYASARCAHRLESRHARSVGRHGIRSVLRHIHSLSAHADSTEDSAPNCSEYIQLYAARGGCIGESVSRNVRVHMEAGARRGTGFQRSMACDKVEIAPRHQHTESSRIKMGCYSPPNSTTKGLGKVTEQNRLRANKLQYIVYKTSQTAFVLHKIC